MNDILIPFPRSLRQNPPIRSQSAWNSAMVVYFDGGVAGLEDGEGGGIGVEGHFHGGGVAGGWGGVHFSDCSGLGWRLGLKPTR